MTQPLVLPPFDPKSVPVFAVDAHLPPVAPSHLTPNALRQRFAHPPEWAPEVRRDSPLPGARTPAAAAVLIPLVMRSQGLTVLLTERTGHMSTHAGQVAFPGGRVDSGDADATAAALREAHEEVGLDEAQAEVLGSLPLYTTVTSFVITPVVALIQPTVVWTPNPNEVARLFEVPLSFLMTPAQHRRHAHHWMGQRREWMSMPWVDDAGHEHFIWGATANMLRNLYRFLSAD